jgi:hypothetical protein
MRTTGLDAVLLRVGGDAADGFLEAFEDPVTKTGFLPV